MTTKQTSPTEEAGSTPVSIDASGVEPKPSGREFLREARRDLTLDEAASVAGIRWFQYDLERLDRECSSLQRTVEGARTQHEMLLAKFNDQRGVYGDSIRIHRGPGE